MAAPWQVAREREGGGRIGMGCEEEEAIRAAGGEKGGRLTEEKLKGAAAE